MKELSKEQSIEFLDFICENLLNMFKVYSTIITPAVLPTLVWDSKEVEDGNLELSLECQYIPRHKDADKLKDKDGKVPIMPIMRMQSVTEERDLDEEGLYNNFLNKTLRWLAFGSNDLDIQHIASGTADFNWLSHGKDPVRTLRTILVESGLYPEGKMKLHWKDEGITNSTK